MTSAVGRLRAAVLGRALLLWTVGPLVTALAAVVVLVAAAAPADAVSRCVSGCNGGVPIPPQPVPADVYDLLPAWRWGVPTFYSNYGVGTGSIYSAAFLVVASILFSIAGALWSVLLYAIREITNVNLVTSLAGDVDRIFDSVGRAVGLGGGGGQAALWVTVLCLGVVYAFFVHARSGHQNALRTVVRTMAPLAVLVVMFSASLGDNGTGNAVGSPVWLAKTLQSDADDISAGVFTSFSGSLLSPESIGPAPSCSGYEAQLQADFETQAEADGASGAGVYLPAAISNLWTRAMFDPWAEAQFGNDPTGLRVACRYAEQQAGVSWQAQQAVQEAADVTSGDPAYGTPDAELFYSGGDNNRMTQELIFWASCAFAGGGHFSLAPGFEVISPPSPTPSGCQRAWDTDPTLPSDLGSQLGDLGFYGQMNGAFQWASNGQTYGDIFISAAAEPAAAYFAHSWNSPNGPQSIILGLLALLDAVIYGFAFGGLTLGLLLAQIVFILTIGLLPILLVWLAVPRRDGNSAAWKLLRTGFSSVVADVVFGLLVSVLLTMIEVIDQVLNTLNGSATGTADAPPPAGAHLAAAAVGNSGTFAVGYAASVEQTIAPLAAFLLVRFVMRKVGMSSLLSLTGSAGMTAAVLAGPARRSGRKDAVDYASGVARTRFDQNVEPFRRRIDDRLHGRRQKAPRDRSSTSDRIHDAAGAGGAPSGAGAGRRPGGSGPGPSGLVPAAGLAPRAPDAAGDPTGARDGWRATFAEESYRAACEAVAAAMMAAMAGFMAGAARPGGQRPPGARPHGAGQQPRPPGARPHGAGPTRLSLGGSEPVEASVVDGRGEAVPSWALLSDPGLPALAAGEPDARAVATGPFQIAERAGELAAPNPGATLVVERMTAEVQRHVKPRSTVALAVRAGTGESWEDWDAKGEARTQPVDLARAFDFVVGSSGVVTRRGLAGTDATPPALAAPSPVTPLGASLDA